MNTSFGLVGNLVEVESSCLQNVSVAFSIYMLHVIQTGCPFYFVPEYGSFISYEAYIHQKVPWQLPCSGTL